MKRHKSKARKFATQKPAFVYVGTVNPVYGRASEYVRTQGTLWRRYCNNYFVTPEENFEEIFSDLNRPSN